MAKIKVTETYFREPEKISEDTFLSLKREISRNPNFEIDPNPETFSGHFSSDLKIIKICAVIILLGLIISLLFSNYPNDLADKLGGGVAAISSLVIAFAGLRMFFEGPSYSTYIKNKKDYFFRMKNVIKNTNSYREFVFNF